MSVTHMHNLRPVARPFGHHGMLIALPLSLAMWLLIVLAFIL